MCCENYSKYQVYIREPLDFGRATTYKISTCVSRYFRVIRDAAPLKLIAMRPVD